MNKETIDEMIRVDHAGEYGAKRIYAGQLFILGKDPTIEHMAAQEAEHLDAFQTMVIQRHVRPSILQPFWHVGGFMMGAITALMGRNAAHACTAAVEDVIDLHYQSQLQNLSADDEPQLHALIEKCHLEECAHRDIAKAEANVALDQEYPILTTVITQITKAAIRIAKKI